MQVLSRRDLLRAGAIGGVVSSLGSSAFLNSVFANLPSDRKIRMAVVGGGFGLCYYWHLHPNAVVTAVTDLREDRQKLLREYYRCDAVFPSLETMLETAPDTFDAVGIFTPAPDHVRHAVACLKKGKHVISAVPAAMTIAECEMLRDAVEKSGKHYMMAETSYYRPSCIAAREFEREGKFGNIILTEAEYHHPRSPNAPKRDNRLDVWRWGLPPMLYPTHCTAFLVGVTGERLTQVSCVGYDNGDPALKGNPYDNPFMSETAFFKTNRGNAMRVAVLWAGALSFCERAQWIGEKMSFYDYLPGIYQYKERRVTIDKESDPTGFTYGNSVTADWTKEEYEQRLPQTLAEGFGKYHDGAEVFLTHEFISALVEDRPPAVNVHEALAMTAPGIIAHQSALQGGAQLAVPQFDR
ncbi:MAG: Gfo/Idh/MocA family oxidoreductase [Planctomycetaceae bacterium]|nr:Gfo/Idh/MocA family oxidoreductase [Planctomycetaceae bacterium]